MTSLNINKLKFIVENSFNQNLVNYNTFIETGTLVGDTIVNLQKFFDKLYTIELSDTYFNLSKNRFNNERFDNVDLILGDSSYVIPKLLQEQFFDNTIFFLDGHWSSGDTAKGDKDCPLIEECSSIDMFYKGKNLIVLIDDYRLFETKYNEDWSEINLNSIKNCFNIFKITSEIVYDDVLGINLSRKNEFFN